MCAVCQRTGFKCTCVLRAAQLSVELFTAASDCHGCKHVLVPEHVSSLLNYMWPGDSATEKQQRCTPHHSITLCAAESSCYVTINVINCILHVVWKCVK